MSGVRPWAARPVWQLLAKASAPFGYDSVQQQQEVLRKHSAHPPFKKPLQRNLYPLVI